MERLCNAHSVPRSCPPYVPASIGSLHVETIFERKLWKIVFIKDRKSARKNERIPTGATNTVQLGLIIDSNNVSFMGYG